MITKNAVSKVSEQLAELKRSDVLSAIRRLDQGDATPFSESTKFDLVHGGRRYPPKRVAGLALHMATGESFGPASFKGGEESSCFRALRRCGFTIVTKDLELNASLPDVIRRVLSLQLEYSSTNTTAMVELGQLIRRAIPDLMRSHVDRLAPIFDQAGYALEIEGSDGKGRKNASPWVRIYDELMSPSATTGWYMVLHFSGRGDACYLTVGCGATQFVDGSLIGIPAAELARRVLWARSVTASALVDTTRFADVIELHGNSLSQQFERATAFAIRHDPHALDERVFWDDVEELCRLLVQLYDSERTGKAPSPIKPEVEDAKAAIAAAISPRRSGGRGQGRGLTSVEKKAVELRAMVVGAQALADLGFTDLKDVSRDHSCDFLAYLSGVKKLIEIKGTTSPQADSFMLTHPELRLHRENLGNTALVIVSQIILKRDGADVSAHGGKAEIIHPWNPEEWDFEPMAYQVRRKKFNAPA